ncbi:UDP-glucose 4-epimerase [Sporomusa carbonis]|uniref:NAD-dependent epimerase/dehydratase family protein n=1 Tax=Sporomusa carbonis TaxID=3076075 RepID=UPI003A73B095
MKALVTGGAGFIGSHTVDTLLAKAWEVVVLDNLSTGLAGNINPGAKFIKMDILSNDLLEVFRQEKFDYVVHLAAQTAVPYSMNHPDVDCRINVLGMVNVLEACRQTGVKRVAFASSAAVYGDAGALPIVENTDLKPASFYGLSKHSGEKYLELYSKVHGLNYVVLRYANVYGERQGDGGEGGVISIFTRRIYQNQPVGIFGDGGQTRDFIYVGDVAEANYKSLIAPQAAVNRVYNVSTQTQTSVNDLVAIMAEAAGKQVEKVYLPAREGDIYHSMLSNQAALNLLCWNPCMPLAEGLRRTYHSLKKTM